MSGSSDRRPRRRFTPEFKAEAVRAGGGVRRPDRQGRQGAGDLRLVAGELGPSGPRAEAAGAPTAAERAEIRELRRELERVTRERDILGKAVAYFSASRPEERVMAIYSFIAEEQADPDSDWSVAEMCRVLEVSRSGFYDWQNRPPVGPGARRPAAGGGDRSDLGVLGPHLRRAAHAPRGSASRASGSAASGSRGSWRSTAGRASPAAAGSAPRSSTGPRPRRAISSTGTSTRPPRTREWCGDITYLRTGEGWLYLATVIDLFSRRVIGWSAADHMRTDLVADALTHGGRDPRRHSRPAWCSTATAGSQYTSADVR